MQYVRQVVILFALATPVLACDASADEILNASAFGLADLAPGDDATPIFRRALEACRERGASGLRVPAGTWHLFPDYACEKYLAVANNNPGMKRIVFLLDELDGFTLQGEQAQLVCHGQLLPISADDASNLTIKGISIDWARPFNFQGRVVAVHPEENAFDLRVHDDVVYEIRGDRIVFRGQPSPTPNSWKEWAPPTTELMTWEHNLQWNMWFDGDSLRPIPGEHQWALNPDPQVHEIEPGVVRVFDAVRVMPQVGWVVAVKGMVDPNRTSPAIRVARSDNVLLEDVTINHAGGMGVIMQRTTDITARRLQVTLPAKKGRIVTTTADATHFNGCRGEIVLEDCTFENMLDDATNVHGCFVRVEEVAEPNTLVCRRVHSQQRGLIVMTTGDRVRFATSADLQPYGDASVVSTRELNSDLFEVTLDTIPVGGVRAASGLYNLSWQPNLTVRRCTVRNHRARTMLIATAGDVVIEDNQFEHSSMAGIQFEGDNGFWWESGPTQNVLIRRNLFKNNAGAALRVAPQIDAKRYPQALYHGGIRFEDNQIETFHRRVVEGVAVDGLDFRRNTIRMTDYMPLHDRDSPSFDFASGRNIILEDNNFAGEDPLRTHAGTPSAVPVMRGNSGLAKP